MSKQKNRESLGLSMVKTILVVSFIVFFGALLGAAGYLVKNKGVNNFYLVPTPTLTVIPAATLFPILSDNNSESKENYVYTDEIINPFTGEKYMIRKDQDGGCVVNGAMVCDLVVEKNGNMEVIADLYRRGHTDSDGNYIIDMPAGANLIEFTSPNILILGFESGDHGGSSSSVYEFNIETKNLKKLLKYNISEFTGGEEDVNFYEIDNSDKQLAFVNNKFGYKSEYDSQGIFVVENNKIKEVNFIEKPPYSIEFNIKDNYKNRDLIIIEINAKKYKFDFETEKFDSL